MTIENSNPHWYQVSLPSLPDSDGSCTVGSKWVEITPGKSIHFIIIRQANGDYVVRGDQASLLNESSNLPGTHHLCPAGSGDARSGNLEHYLRRRKIHISILSIKG